MKKNTSGFTIVAYNGIQNRAYDSAISSSYSQIAKALEIYYSDNGTYPQPGTTVFVYARDAGTNPSLESLLGPSYVNPMPYAQGVDQYVYNSTTGGYGIRLIYKSQPVCKAGVDMNPTWWSSIPEC